MKTAYRTVIAASVSLYAAGCGGDEGSVSTTDYVPPSSYAEDVAPEGKTGLAFSEVASESGLSFVHVNGAFGRKWMPETVGMRGSSHPLTCPSLTNSRSFRLEVTM